uniref:NAD(P)-binding domain-containing protein n=1 Tax=Lotharella globosa TaxID=91324 RepID=A0A7S3Z7F5_9EUKA|mmetsp:Transcript_19752/g.38111  ORF Transcript_19752/g.38111 Transcript_19752/m.38111 type:complete len:296 (+) Transcript_19752:99-986(+)
MRTFAYLGSLLLAALLPGPSAATKVVVTGAAGRTGRLVLDKLLKRGVHDPKGLVRTEKSMKRIAKLSGPDALSKVEVCDVTSLEALEKAFAGSEAVVLCTSAVPKIKLRSILKVLALKLIGKKGRPTFRFPPNGDPYHVDWLGAKNQIDAAKKAGVKHMVFVGSMGGTQEDNFLNSIGRVEGEELSGNILKWKRKAEEHLIASGMDYTIVHPGGLLDKEGGRKIIFGVNDELLERKTRSIPRDDVAECCVAALSVDEAKRRSFDIISEDPADTKEPFAGMDWNSFFSTNKANCNY